MEVPKIIRVEVSADFDLGTESPVFIEFRSAKGENIRLGIPQELAAGLADGLMEVLDKIRSVLPPN